MRTMKFLLALAAMALSAPVQARAPIDCPLRDAPFSAQSPLIDLLLSPAAKAVLDRETGGRIDKLPPMFLNTQPPTFGAILTLKENATWTGLSPSRLEAVDQALRALPVTPADRAARCARYDNDRPHFDFPRDRGKPRILIFEKINGFKDTPSVEAARAALVAMAQRKGWYIAATQSGGAINPATLRQFDVVFWNNVSGDVLTLSQRRALQRYLERGGGFVAVHGSAGDFNYFWDWYADSLIGARFIGHTLAPQFQNARIVVDRQHPLAASLPAEWTMTDEWYSFRGDPRAKGANVLLSLDEASYNPVGPMGTDIRMGSHPLAWTNCIKNGRMFYSAIGHKPETYAEPNHVKLLEAAIEWAATARRACR